MPFKSKAQQRYMFAAEARGDLKKGTAREFAEDTDFKKIPERVKKADMKFNAKLLGGLTAAGGLGGAALAHATRHKSDAQFASAYRAEKKHFADSGADMSKWPSLEEARANQRSPGKRMALGAKLGLGAGAVGGLGGIALGEVGVRLLNKFASGSLKGDFWEGFHKEASGTSLRLSALEIAGLGTLAAPAVAGLSGQKMKEHHKDLLEVGGLGILAAPYAKDLATAGMGKLRNLRGLKNFGTMAMRIR